MSSTKESPYRRPYKSRRRREASKSSITKPKEGRVLLRLLIGLVAVLIVTLVLIFKDVGKSNMATGTFMSNDK